MLNNLEIEMLDQLLANDRLQTQLFQELFTHLLTDPTGISEDAYNTMCELADASQMIFDDLEFVVVRDGRAYLELETPEETPEELDRIQDCMFIIHVGTAVSDDALWEWIENQEICTIEHGFYDPEEDRIVIHPAWEDQLTKVVLDQLKRDILLKLV